MMARDRGVGDLKGIVLHTADGGFIHIQIVGAPIESRTKDDKFRHRLLHSKLIISTARVKSNGNVMRQNVLRVTCSVNHKSGADEMYSLNPERAIRFRTYTQTFQPFDRANRKSSLGMVQLFSSDLFLFQ